MITNGVVDQNGKRVSSLIHRISRIRNIIHYVSLYVSDVTRDFYSIKNRYIIRTVEDVYIVWSFATLILELHALRDP